MPSKCSAKGEQSASEEPKAKRKRRGKHSTSENDVSSNQESVPKPEVPKNKEAKLLSNKCSKADSTAEAQGGFKTSSYEWCSNYPGSLPSTIPASLKKWNTKLVSWNINGLRSWLKSGGLEYLKSELPDVLALQEIKLSSAKLPPEVKIPDYFEYWSHAEKDGYAGTGLYCKQKPLTLKYGIGKSDHDKEGRVITAEFENFFFVTAYVPNSGQGLVRLPYRRNQWDPHFAEYLKDLDSKKPIVVCGDLNVAHEEIDLANPASNHKTAGFTDDERNNFTKLLEDVKLVDTYRKIYPDREKAFTFWSQRRNGRPGNIGWRLDYFLVSERLFSNVCDHEIRCGVGGSDHCPIVLYMSL
ncbi:unnamed protein product [Calicophoron daubneyi]|uniref:DNA-(apurinic or apyrimidinic site) endonuclease n=1 Tax=Calicophoron daubneyi TaxID=300641 RepID=A0AAV2TNT2_CALDB